MPNPSRVRGIFNESQLCGRKITLDAQSIFELGVKDETTGLFKGWASTSQKNSHGFVILSKAWADPRAFERYINNPVVLYQHKKDYVVGNALVYEGRDEGLWVELEYERMAVLPTQLTLGDMVDRGRIRALSCGIEILEVEFLEVGGQLEVLIPAVQLSEITMCSIPSDPGAISSVRTEMTEFVNLVMSESKVQIGGFKMDPKLLRKSLGLPEDASDEQVMAKQNELLLSAERTRNLTRELGLPDNATDDQIRAELGRRRGSDPVAFAALEKENRKLRAKQLVDEHKSKISPALMPWALELAEKDEESFKKFVDTMPVGSMTPPVGTVIPEGVGSGGSGSSKTLTREDEEICQRLGYFENAQKMEEMANVKPNEALTFIFKNKRFALTRYDEDTLRRRREMDRLVGITS